MKNFLAFSLVELVVVIAIIGIMVGVAAPSFSNYYRKFGFSQVLQGVETALHKGFSGARSSSAVFGLRGDVMGAVFSFKCLSRDCDAEDVEEIELDGFFLEKVEFDDEDSVGFEVQFLPPHGDVSFVGDDDADVLKIVFSDGAELSRIVNVYRKSAFVEVE